MQSPFTSDLMAALESVSAYYVTAGIAGFFVLAAAMLWLWRWTLANPDGTDSTDTDDRSS